MSSVNVHCPVKPCSFNCPNIFSLDAHINVHLSSKCPIDSLWLSDNFRSICHLCHKLVSTKTPSNFNKSLNAYVHKNCASVQRSSSNACLSSSSLSQNNDISSSSTHIAIPSSSSQSSSSTSSSCCLSASPPFPSISSSSVPSSSVSSSIPSSPPLSTPTYHDVFSSFIPVRSHLPRSCAKLFALALRFAIDQVMERNDSFSWAQLISLPKCTIFVPPSSSSLRLLSKREIFAQKTLEVEQTKERLNLFLAGKWVSLFYEARVLWMSVVPRCSVSNSDWQAKVIAKAENGNLGAAFKAMDAAALAPSCADTFSKLQALHPPGLGNGLIHDASFVRSISPDFMFVEPKLVQSCIYSFPKGTASGPDGLKVQHLLDVLRFCPAESDADPRKSIARLLSVLISGKAPLDLAPFLAGARLVPLQKKDNGIRPIAIGSTWRRLAAKLLVHSFQSAFCDFFEPLQLGVGSKQGSEAIVHATQRLVDLNSAVDDFVIFQVDFKNAFNLVDRSRFIEEVRKRFPTLAPFVEWCYCNPSHLLVSSSGHTESISSCNGTQQGDPLGPFLFSIVCNILIQEVADMNPGLKMNAWYMDDGTIAGSSAQVAAIVKHIIARGPSLGLHLNASKSMLFWPSGSNYGSALFDEKIGRATSGGIVTLGCPIGSPAFISNFLEAKVNKLVLSLNKLPLLSHTHVALQLLLKCSSFCKFSFLLRMICPSIILPFSIKFDSSVLDVFYSIFAVPPSPSSHLQVALPLSKGGLGLRSTALHAPAAFISSFNGCKKLISLLVSSVNQSILLDFVSIFAHSKLMLCNNIDSSSSKIDVLMVSSSQKFISSAIDSHSFAQFFQSLNRTDKARVLALQDSPQGLIFDVPLDKVRGFALSTHDLRFVVCSRLGIAVMCNEGDPCPQCQTPMDSAGYHMAICKKGPSVVHRHHSLRDLIADFCSKAALSPSIEFNCFSSSNLTPADVYLPRGGVSGIPLALDVTVIHPLQDSLLSKSSTESGQGCAFAEAKKHKKYDLLSQEENIDFIPLVVEFFGSWGPEANKFFSKLAKSIAGRTGSSVTDVALQIQRQLCVCLIRCNAKAVAKRTSVLSD